MALVILAEDDYEVRLSIKLLLEDDGHSCLEFSGGDDALDALRSNLDAKLLILDVFMQNSDGRDIVSILRNGPPRFRKFPVLLISGLVPEQTMKLHIKDEYCQFLKKPFTGEIFRQIVDSLLEMPSSPSQ